MTASAIRRVFPLGFQWETKDPFLFCVHHEDFYPKGNEQLGPNTPLTGRKLGEDFMIKDGFRMYHGKTVPGFPAHPHKGFETVTIVRKGFVDHTDSMGASSRYGEADVQWMTAGKGVQHAEMFPLIYSERDNPLELFQIWLNLPAQSKHVNPHFAIRWNEEKICFQEVDEDNLSSSIEVICGNFKNVQAPILSPDSWAANPNNDVAIWHIHMQAHAQLELPKASKDVHRVIYFYKGQNLLINNENIQHYHGIEVNPTEHTHLKAGQDEVQLLVLQGKPIQEPVAQYGPFVMNSQLEIQQAFEDFRKNQFGGWPWPSHDYVHDKNKGRFAIHADGRQENK
ncbi:MAG: pirin family protein [Chitinophagaceae bacterium]